MLIYAFPFYLIATLFVIAAVGSFLGAAEAFNEWINRRSNDALFAAPARFAVFCMLLAAVFFYIAALISARGV